MLWLLQVGHLRHPGLTSGAGDGLWNTAFPDRYRSLSHQAPDWVELVGCITITSRPIDMPGRLAVPANALFSITHMAAVSSVISGLGMAVRVIGKLSSNSQATPKRPPGT